MLTFVPALPHQQQVAALHEYRTLQGWLHEITEKIEMVEGHLAICGECAAEPSAWEARALALERQAQLEERLTELEGHLELLEN